MNEVTRTITIRLPVSGYRRLERAARSERRKLNRYLEDLIQRDLLIQDEAHQGVLMFVPPDAIALRREPGELLRTEGESDARYADRQQVFSELMKLPIAG
jgi:hypothetical protein